MSGKKISVLAVDDDPNNLRLLGIYLQKMGYSVIEASDGVEAWEILQAQWRQIRIVLLDRMMPNMNGLDLLAKIKANENMKKLPVIMQTAAAEKHQVIEGIGAGAYYYLTKPFEEDVLCAIVGAALGDYGSNSVLQAEVDNYKSAMCNIIQSSFEFRTLDEASNLVTFLANMFPAPEDAVIGISEMLINAVEHGNLAIDYNLKKQLIISGKWQEEIANRLKLESNINKLVRVKYQKTDSQIILTVKDAGNGFDWEDYMAIDPDRAADPNGRGIALASLASFDLVEYKGCGNEVVCSVNLT